jgi:hypothetical protein
VPAAAPRESAPVPATVAIPSLALPADSDLVLVETRFATPAAEEEEADASRPRRVRPPRPAVKEEPLQMVETRKHDGA